MEIRDFHKLDSPRSIRFNLLFITTHLKVAKDTVFSTKKILKLNGNALDLSTPIVMGILNLTPDSFYDGGRYTDEKSVVLQAEKMLSEGASILDIGGYSSRPGAAHIPEEVEASRVVTGIKAIHRAFPEANISIDTFRSNVARQAIEHGAAMINDISAGTLDRKMPATVAQLKVPYVMMHLHGTPQDMTAAHHIQYENLMEDIIDYFVEKVFQLNQMGIKDIIIDPGFGFAKTTEQNYVILKNLKYFQVLKLPILVGLSRKSMIYKVLGTSAEAALNGTSVLNTLALTKGAGILRVHDVKEAAEAIQLFKTTDY